VRVGVNIQNVPGGGLLATYLNGQVLFQSGNNIATVPVSLTVGGNTLTQINPLSIVKTFGGANPLPQTITATSIGADSVFAVSEFTGTGGDWLSVFSVGELRHAADRYRDCERPVQFARRILHGGGDTRAIQWRIQHRHSPGHVNGRAPVR